jgi:hypothetical protein
MTHYNNNANSYPTDYAAGNSDVHPEQNLSPASEAANIQMFNTLEHLWDWVEQPVPMVAPPTKTFAQNNYSKHHDRRLVNRSLTRGLQVRWPRPPSI